MRRLGVGLALVALVAVAGACGSSGPNGPTLAVTAFYSALARNDVTAACLLVRPDQQAGCPGRIGGGTWRIAQLEITRTLTDGEEAVVVATGTICEGSTCHTNVYVAEGLPAPGSTFDAAFVRAARSALDSASAAVRIDGRWYVQL